MGCLTQFAKYILFCFNFLIFLCAIALIAIGSINIVNNDKGVDWSLDYNVGAFAIAVGCIILVIAFFGCCGAIKQNSCMLTTYAVILITLLILQIALGALALVAVSDSDNTVEKDVMDAVTKVFNKYKEDPTDSQLDIVREIQETFKCCGPDGLQWYLENSAAIKGAQYCQDPDDASNKYGEGCAQAFKNAIFDNLEIIGGIAIGFAVVELFGAIFACMVRKQHN